MNSQTFADATGDSAHNHNPNKKNAGYEGRKSAGDKLPRRVRAGRKSASAFRTISEVADELDVQQHVLRFWETKFSQVRPLKRGGGRRFYRPEDIDLLKCIHHLLYTEGYTIKGVQKLLREKGKRAFVEENLSPQTAPQASNNSVHVEGAAKDTPTKGPAKSALGEKQRKSLMETLAELKELRSLVSSEG